MRRGNSMCWNAENENAIPVRLPKSGSREGPGVPKKRGTGLASRDVSRSGVGRGLVLPFEGIAEQILRGTVSDRAMDAMTRVAR